MRVTQLTALLLQHEVDTAADLRQWLGVSGNTEALLTIHGVGRKTVDYLKKLSGLTAVPVDRHLARFASLVGCQAHTYDELANMYCAVADLLDVDVSLLDSAIWDYGRSHNGSLTATHFRWPS
jgi:endonuclease III